MEEEGELVELDDLIRTKLYDAQESRIGHLHDLALDLEAERPLVTHLGAHLEWTDQVGGIELVRPVEDIVFLIPWSEVAREDEVGLHLSSIHPNFPAASTKGRVLARRDLLNKQMVDEDGNRLQRVDNVLLEKVGRTLFLVGIEVGLGWLPASATMEKILARLRLRHGAKPDLDLIPWEAIARVDEDQVVITV